MTSTKKMHYENLVAAAGGYVVIKFICIFRVLYIIK